MSYPDDVIERLRAQVKDGQELIALQRDEIARLRALMDEARRAAHLYADGVGRDGGGVPP